MKKIVVFAIICGVVRLCGAAEWDDSIDIGPMPSIKYYSPKLERAMKGLRQRIEDDSKECIDNAHGMEASGIYQSKLKKIIETPRVLVIEVSSTMQCDGVHSSSYRYAIAFDIGNGGRVDINRIYNVGVRQDSHIFLRRELIEPAKQSYREVNENNARCLETTGWQDDLINYPITISPDSSGDILLYYSVPDVEASCFPILKIGRRDIVPYRDSKRAAEYDLP